MAFSPKLKLNYPPLPRFPSLFLDLLLPQSETTQSSLRNPSFSEHSVIRGGKRRHRPLKGNTFGVMETEKDVLETRAFSCCLDLNFGDSNQRCCYSLSISDRTK